MDKQDPKLRSAPHRRASMSAVESRSPINGLTKGGRGPLVRPPSDSSRDDHSRHPAQQNLLEDWRYQSAQAVAAFHHDAHQLLDPPSADSMAGSRTPSVSTSVQSIERQGSSSNLARTIGSAEWGCVLRVLRVLRVCVRDLMRQGERGREGDKLRA